MIMRKKQKPGRRSISNFNSVPGRVEPLAQQRRRNGPMLPAVRACVEALEQRVLLSANPGPWDLRQNITSTGGPRGLWGSGYISSPWSFGYGNRNDTSFTPYDGTGQAVTLHFWNIGGGGGSFSELEQRESE